MTASPLDRNVSWRPAEGAGLEHCHIIRSARDTSIRGAVITPSHGFFYVITLDDEGRVRSIHIERTDGRRLDLVADGSGSWADGGGDPRPALHSCIDVDFSATPLTNSLPIWRSDWTVGQSRRFVMAWIDADDLSVVPDEQIYTRLDDNHFRYQAADGSFERVIETDADGLVVSYPGLFVRSR
jgi:hypothetical protein